MEKEQPESLTTVTIKPDYAPSEVYSSEPPPAYMKPQTASVQVAKIVAVTVVVCSVVLGSFLLASAYVTANASCRQLEQELALLGEAADRFQPSGQPLQPEALIQEQPVHKENTEPLLQAEETNNSKKPMKEVDNNNIDEPSDSASDDNSEDSSSDSSSDASDESDEEDRPAIHFKLPLQLDFDDLAGALIEKNQKSRMNCVVEKKRAEEIVDHQPKTVRLPFGVNLTTDPRYEKISGERMAIFCESGNFQRAEPQPQQPQQQQQDEDDDSDDAIMIQPVMIPIPASHYPTHMPVQQQPQQPQQPHIQMIHAMETMRPPMPPMMQQFIPQQQQQQPQSQMPPNPIIQHIIQQIIAQKIMEQQRAQEENDQEAEQRQMPQSQGPRMILAQGMNRLPIPEEVLTQLNRLPHREGIVVVSEQQESDDDSNQEPEQMQIVQHQRTSPDGMNGRQTYPRGLPINIPVPMMQQQQQEQQDATSEQQEPQAAASEEARPHYVQPRSVRSVDALLPKSTKRVKRCSCDCAC